LCFDAQRCGSDGVVVVLCARKKDCWSIVENIVVVVKGPGMFGMSNNTHWAGNEATNEEN
jgi:hypothetical protein